MEAQGEKLLQNLVDHEQSLVSKVEDAQKEAADIVRKAEAEAEEIRAQARQKADKLAKEQAEQIRDEREKIRKEVLDRSAGEVDEIRERADANKEQGVQLVLERILP
ncbi:MAG: V-type ATPase subunit subunit G family protein [Trueperaceae bacterium]|nr:V-type ATPase subunit subunit G family protein [Trueperaceae bacterium]